jgi:hypothetical protein
METINTVTLLNLIQQSARLLGKYGSLIEIEANIVQKRASLTIFVHLSASLS